MKQEIDKEQCLGIIRERLLTKKTVVFAYVHGSFITAADFNDIDVALFVESRPISTLDYELELEGELGGALREAGITVPVDVRVLNDAPLAFKYRAGKSSHILFSRDENRRTDFEVHARSLYFDYAYLRDRYLAGALGRAV